MGSKTKRLGSAAVILQYLFSIMSTTVLQVDNDDDFVDNNDDFVLLCEHKLSPRAAVLFSPIYMGFSNDKECAYITPLAAPFNARDASSTRLDDGTKVIYLQQSQFHITFGKYFSSSANEIGLHPLKPMTNRLAKIPNNLFFTTEIPLDTALQQKCVRLLEELYTQSRQNSSMNSNLPDVINQFKIVSNVNAAIVLARLMAILDKILNCFATVEDFQVLNRAVEKLLDEGSTNNLLQSERNLRLHAVADTIRKFQLYMEPIMMSFHDGNHRFLRSVLEVMGCDAVDVSPETNGFVLPEQITLAAMPVVPRISYHIYGVSNIHVSSSQMKAEKMQSLSKLINKRHEQTMLEEMCYQILFRCTCVLSSIMDCSELKQMPVKYLDYLRNVRWTDTKNAVPSGSYLTMRSMKETLRRKIHHVFFPDHADVQREYKMGNTYVEIYYKRSLNIIFGENEVTCNAVNLHVFLLLDCIFVPNEISSFINMLQASYFGKHADRSKVHNIKHTTIWNCTVIWESMTRFIICLIDMMKNEKTIGWVKHLKQIYKKHQAILKQKISHSCQQYAYFIALAIADRVGLFPEIPGSQWKAGNKISATEDWARFNVFSYLERLFSYGKQKNGDAEEEQPMDEVAESSSNSSSSDESSSGIDDEISWSKPGRKFFDQVISYYFEKLITVNGALLDKQTLDDDVVFIPLTYQEFCDMGMDRAVEECFNDLKSFSTDFNTKFFENNKKIKAV